MVDLITAGDVRAVISARIKMREVSQMGNFFLLHFSF